MMSCLRPRTEGSMLSRKLDKQLLRHHKNFEKAVKILLLGTGESGKTTVIKQMKILHINGFTKEERLSKLKSILQNAHESIYELTVHVLKFGLDFESTANRQRAAYIMRLGPQVPDNISDEYVDHANALWSDSGVQECFKRSNEFQLIDSAKYFLDRLPILTQKGYVPTTEDILFCRKITTGIQQINFSVTVPKNMGGGSQEFRMFDVGGQRDQRNKWLQVFEGIQAVLFVISCGDFDQTLREEGTKNRLVEAFELFASVWHNRFLAGAGIIVFLNKQDIMEQKIKSGKSIGGYFPEYDSFRISSKDGNIFDECDRTRCFIRQKLMNITEQPCRRISQLSTQIHRECYYHFTVATDTSNVKKVFTDVHHMILTENLVNMGLL